MGIDLEQVEKLAIALGLGLLVGFQREWTAPHVAGIRTFALITLFGFLLGSLQERVGNWLIATGLLVVAAMILVGNVLRFITDEHLEDEPGLTTEIAALIMYVVGVIIAFDQFAIGLMVTGSTAVLLHWKQRLHGLVGRTGETDLRAIIQLVLIALVILPALPNESFGPYSVLNPFEIWLMVVLIVGISLGGYIAYQFLGSRSGALVAGLLGGMISSTATTVSYARQGRRTPGISSVATLVIMLASTVVFARVLIEVAIVAPQILSAIVPPLAVMMSIMAIITAVVYLLDRRESAELPLESDPSELKVAIVFGLLYAGVLFAVAAVKQHFGDQALYAVAALSGLTDMDAITLSTAQLIKRERLEVDTGWRMILIGFLSNLFFKGLAVAVLSSRALAARIGIVFGVALVGGIFILVYWP